MKPANEHGDTARQPTKSQERRVAASLESKYVDAIRQFLAAWDADECVGKAVDKLREVVK